MSVEFNHTIVLSRDREKSARFLAGVLGLEVGEPTGMFLPVTTANGVTLDFATVDTDIPTQHYAFLVSEEEFDAVLARLVEGGVPIQADPHGRYPRRINRNDGGRGVYFTDPSGHGMEAFTRPYGSDPSSLSGTSRPPVCGGRGGLAVRMRTVYRGELPVAHWRFHVDSRREPRGPVPSEGCAGQTDGLCGPAVPGCLFLCTGVRSGPVALTVEVHGAAPPLDDHWEDVVEASFRPLTASTAVLPCGHGTLCEVALPPADHRVRYCGRGLDGGAGPMSSAAREAGPVGQYLLQFWPAPPTADRVVRRTARGAAHRHHCAGALGSPVSGEPSERERAEIRSWGGRLPSPRVREAGDVARGLVPLDRDLLDAVDAACPATQRGLARWAARRAFTAAGLDGVDWIASALAALDRGEPLPAPFDDTQLAWERFFTDDRTALTAPDPPGVGHGAPLCRALALPALRAAADPDPLRAALGTLFAAAAAHGTAYPTLFAEARRRFPGLGGSALPGA